MKRRVALLTLIFGGALGCASGETTGDEGTGGAGQAGQWGQQVRRGSPARRARRGRRGTAARPAWPVAARRGRRRGGRGGRRRRRARAGGAPSGGNAGTSGGRGGGGAGVAAAAATERRAPPAAGGGRPRRRTQRWLRRGPGARGTAWSPSRTITSTTSRPATTARSPSASWWGFTPRNPNQSDRGPHQQHQLRDELRPRLPEERGQRMDLQHRPRQQGLQGLQRSDGELLHRHEPRLRHRPQLWGPDDRADPGSRRAAKHTNFKGVAPVAASNYGGRQVSPIPVMYIQGRWTWCAAATASSRRAVHVRERVRHHDRRIRA